MKGQNSNSNCIFNNTIRHVKAESAYNEIKTKTSTKTLHGLSVKNAVIVRDKMPTKMETSLKRNCCTIVYGSTLARFIAVDTETNIFQFKCNIMQ